MSDTKLFGGFCFLTERLRTENLEIKSNDDDNDLVCLLHDDLRGWCCHHGDGDQSVLSIIWH